jgi:regulator of sigma D
MTVPQARSAIRKALTGIVDPKPRKSAITAMWVHFDRKCAFCRRSLDRDKREGHADHLVAGASRGHNHIYNRVLACGTCNGDQKLDHPWEDFLRSVVCQEEDFTTRKQRIEKWQQNHKDLCKVDQGQITEALRAAENVITVFDQACDKIRALKS